METEPIQRILKFPEGFLWGAATSSFQVEGGIDNNDWAEGSRNGLLPPIGRACDHYNRYESDFDIAQSLGHNCHRLSIEWSRIEPAEGKFDLMEIEHYRNVLKALHKRNMVPFVTLWHFSVPIWFSESGGFDSRSDAPEIFARYCAFVVEHLGDLCKHFATINEAMPLASNGWRRGTWPPFREWPGFEWALSGVPGAMPLTQKNKSISNIYKYFRVMSTFARAHNAAYRAIKKVSPGSEVSIVHQVLVFHANNNPINKLFASILNWHWTYSFMAKVYKQCDSISVNYYLHKKFGETRVYEKSDMNWDIYPEGIYQALIMMKRYQKPLYISEAGIADASDSKRADYIQRLVQHMHKAIEEGADLRGYMYWSLMDNYELAHGYEKRFGLIAINFDTLERTVRDSAQVYARIARSNSVDNF